MKRTKLNIPFAPLVLLAAIALIFAASCSDDPTGDLSGQSESVESADDTGSQEKDSESADGTGSQEKDSESVDGTGSQEKDSESADGTGSQDEQDEQNKQGEQDEQDKTQAITQDDVLALIQEIGQLRGTNAEPVSNVCWDFPSATLDEDAGGIVAVVPWVKTIYRSPSPYIEYTLLQLQGRGNVSTSLLSVDLTNAEWDEDTAERTQTAKGTSGKRYVTVAIVLAEGVSCEFPEELQSVTFALDSGETTWKNSVGL